MPVIGFLNLVSSDVYTDRLRAFRQGLKDTGYVEGANLAIEYRWAENQPDRLRPLATELARREVAVIVAAGGGAAAVAAKAATTTVPIIFSTAEDPVRLGLVASLARPDGNLTGFNILVGEMGESGWSSCASWCPQPFAWPCSSIRPMRPVPEAR